MGALVAALVVVGVVAVASPVLGSGGVEISRDGESEKNETASDPVVTVSATTTASVVVHVDGAVAKPGVYEVAGSTVRVDDAIKAAGGLTKSADTSTLNLAAKIEDASKVHVPKKGEAVTMASGDVSGTASTGTTVSPADGTGRININTATAEQLDGLPGVGEATANAIIKDREANGAFSSAEDLMRVSGIGEKKFAKMKDMVCV